MTMDEPSFYFYMQELTKFLHERKWELSQDQCLELNRERDQMLLTEEAQWAKSLKRDH